MAKRQTRGSSSTPGVFTRSRSELFVHRNRSGRVRPDPSRGPRPRLDSISPPPSSERLSAAAVKDPRTTRVISPEASPVKRDAIAFVEGGKKTIDPAEEEAERIELAGGGADEVVEPSGGPEVELIHCTPAIYQNAMEAESASQDLTTAGGTEAVADVTVESTYPPKSRLLYENPNSFGYRRLPPYLTGLANDNSGGAHVVCCKDYPVKVGKVTEETTLVPTEGKFSNDRLSVGGSNCSVVVESSETFGFVASPVDISPDKNPSNGDLHDLEVTTTNLCNQRGLEFDEVKFETCLHDPLLESKLMPSPSCSSPAIQEPLSEEVMKPSDGSKELIHCTPPDNENAMEVENMSQDQTVLHVPVVIAADVKMESADPRKRCPALIQCSRSKLYRNSSSFSYRRLLPYLMNIAKDDSGGTRVVSCKDYPVKVEKVVEETDSLPTKGKLSVDQHLVESSRCSVTVESSETLGFVESPRNMSPNESSSNGELHDLEVTMSNLCNQIGLEFEEIKFEDCLHDPILESKLLCNPSISPHAVRESLSEEELAGNVLARPFLPSKAEFSCNMIGPVSDVRGKSLPRTSLLGSIHSLERQALAPIKGILKKHTRSCKGICMCLDCVTFRIHANYAFDFSRKQMKDADEIILGLVKELAGLRNLVEKSIIPTFEGTRTCAFLQLNQIFKSGTVETSMSESLKSRKNSKQP
ncbi:hypothetical protein MUK42_01917 [Musa troglodytarum]|uniref:Uncharacterized protein n=1 Tax=Musa troglodytarum TaxID=320322 RepID=A0A9E7FCH4_9LILI|nr:hypothetical protein MUK42_01917 [Musa troglodytarum]